VTPTEITPEDERRLAERGISRAEIERQLALFRDPPAPLRIDRPATTGDGIEEIAEGDRPGLRERWERAAADGRLMKFVPASGAASRMFRDLAQDDPDPADLARFEENLARFAFGAAVREIAGDLSGLDPVGRRARLVEALLGPDGLDAATLPKGLIPFHRYPAGPRTPFEEHLVEGLHQVRRADGNVPVHFTISPQHHDGFVERLGGVTALLDEADLAGTRFAVSFSEQDPASDTVAVHPDNRPFRDADGAILLRPGGHGALLRNLRALDGDVVLVKNIDNVVPDDRKDEVHTWKRLLTGRFLAVEERIHSVLDELEDGDEARALSLGADLCRDVLGRPVPGDAAELREALDRPLRVCGVVRNAGEPGGGPFWVRDPDGGAPTRQIVELSQIAVDDPAQRARVEKATHFNPVDLVVGLRDHRGRAFDLDRFVDERTVFLAEKSHEGRPLKALERPGLWNGAMAGWNTLFVAVPLATFAPVKTVFDLLRPEHQPRA
jgi:hypothetical protein